MDVAHGFGLLVGNRVRAEVRLENRVVRGTTQSPLVRDVVDGLVLVTRVGQSTFLVLEGDRVRVLVDLSGQTAGGQGPSLGLGIGVLRELHRRNGGIVREKLNLGSGIDVLEVIDLDSDHALGRGMNADAEDGSYKPTS